MCITRDVKASGDIDRESALTAILAAACEQVADGPQSYSEARTDYDWMVEFLEQAGGRPELRL